MKIDFKTNELDLFAKPYYDYRKNKKSGKRVGIFYGGASSSKSYSVHQSELIDLINQKSYDTLFVRKNAADIENSCYKLLQDLALKWDITNLFTWAYSGSKRQIKNRNGKRILFRGIDDPGKVKSIAGIGRIVIEEADQLDEADFNELNRRARGIKGIQVILIFNPISEDHWIKKRFFDNKAVAAKTSVHRYTYKDNVNKEGRSFLTTDDIRELEDLKDIDEVDYMVYVLGLWGKKRTGQEFYNRFKRNVHVGKVPFLPYIPVIGNCWDFNVVPYITDVLVQVRPMQREGRDILQVRVFKEYCLDGELNSIEGVYSQFDRDFGDKNVVINFYGDSTGRNRIVGLGNISNYDMIENTFAKYYHESWNRVLRRNPNAMKKRDFVNGCLTGKYGIEIIIDESCAKTIKDFEEIQLGPNGKHKKKVKDKVTGVVYEEVGHPSDALDGFLCEEFWSAVMGDESMW